MGVKKTFKRVLQNLVQIDFDNENYEFDDDNGDNIDDYDNENYQNPDKYHIDKKYPASPLSDAATSHDFDDNPYDRYTTHTCSFWSLGYQNSI